MSDSERFVIEWKDFCASVGAQVESNVSPTYLRATYYDRPWRIRLLAQVWHPFGLKGIGARTFEHWRLRMACSFLNSNALWFYMGPTRPLLELRPVLSYFRRASQTVRVGNDRIDDFYVMMARRPDVLRRIVRLDGIHRIATQRERMRLCIRDEKDGAFSGVPRSVDELEMTIHRRGVPWEFGPRYLRAFRFVLQTVMGLSLPKQPLPRARSLLAGFPGDTREDASWSGPDVRRWALEQVLERRKIEDLLVRLLHDPDPGVSMLAAKGLHARGDPAGAQHLVRSMVHVVLPGDRVLASQILHDAGFGRWANAFHSVIAAGSEGMIGVLRDCPHRRELVDALETVADRGAPGYLIHAVCALAELGSASSFQKSRTFAERLWKPDATPERLAEALARLEELASLPQPVESSAGERLPRPATSAEASRSELPRPSEGFQGEDEA